MNIYRHRNGGGAKVYPAQASPDSFIDRLSTVEGESNVYTSTIHDSALKDSFADRSKVNDSLVADCRLAEALLRNSDITRTHIVCALVEASRLTDCRIFADEGVPPQVSGVTLSGVTVYGNACLRGTWGLELEGAHVHAGVWEQPPRHLLVEDEGVHVAVLECTEGRAHMGCECRPVTYWLKKGPRIARRLGWDEEQIEACLTFLKSLA